MSKDYNEKLNYLPEKNQEAIKTLIDGTINNITAMTPQQRESMITICYQQLEPELKNIDYKEFGCSSYFEFLSQLVLAAAYVDNDFSLDEEEACDEVMKTVGLLGQPYDGDIEKLKNLELDLSKVSGMLSPPLRAMFFNFASMIFLSDKELNDDEYDMMIDILIP